MCVIQEQQLMLARQQQPLGQLSTLFGLLHGRQAVFHAAQPHQLGSLNQPEALPSIDIGNAVQAALHTALQLAETGLGLDQRRLRSA